MELAVLNGSSSVIAQCPEKLSNAGKVIVAQTKIMKKFTMQNSTGWGVEWQLYGKCGLWPKHNKMRRNKFFLISQKTLVLNKIENTSKPDSYKNNKRERLALLQFSFKSHLLPIQEHDTFLLVFETNKIVVW